MLNDDPGHDPRAERHEDPRADGRSRYPLGHGVSQEIEAGNGNRNVDEMITM